MLVLSRKAGEEIVLPNRGVTIGVVAVNGKQVRLSIAAPLETPIHRGEVWHRICESRESSNDLCKADCGPFRVLFADADETVASSYREALGAIGFDVDTVTNGLDCVSRLRKCPPHVLIMDPSILWGGGNGVLALMREESDVPAVPVLVHASPDNGAASANMAFPVRACTSKPLPPEQMASMVGRMINGWGTQQEGATTNDIGTAWQHEIRCKIMARTHGHVVGIEVEVIDGRLIVHGRSRSYYGKQLACAAALDLLETLAPDCAKQVELDIEVLESR
jgi:carbon storage regulator